MSCSWKVDESGDSEVIWKHPYHELKFCLTISPSLSRGLRIRKEQRPCTLGVLMMSGNRHVYFGILSKVIFVNVNIRVYVHQCMQELSDARRGCCSLTFMCVYTHTQTYKQSKQTRLSFLIVK